VIVHSFLFPSREPAEKVKGIIDAVFGFSGSLSTPPAEAPEVAWVRLEVEEHAIKPTATTIVAFDSMAYKNGGQYLGWGKQTKRLLQRAHAVKPQPVETPEESAKP